MSMDLSGFVRRVTKLTLGTKEFTFTELNMADMAEFKSDLNTKRKAKNRDRRNRLINDARQIKTDFDPLELLKMTDTLMTDEEFQLECETTEGLGALAYFSLRYKHHDVSREDAMQIVTIGALEQITDAMFPEMPEAIKKKRPRQPVKE